MYFSRILNKLSDLMKFQINGNKVFAVNYWHENKKYIKYYDLII